MSGSHSQALKDQILKEYRKSRSASRWTIVGARADGRQLGPTSGCGAETVRRERRRESSAAEPAAVCLSDGTDGGVASLH